MWDAGICAISGYTTNLRPKVILYVHLYNFYSRVEFFWLNQNILMNSKEWKRTLGLQKILDLVNVPIIHPRVLLQGLKIHRYILVDHLHDLSIDIESRSSKSVFILIIFSTPGKVFQVYFGQNVTLG